MLMLLDSDADGPASYDMLDTDSGSDISVDDGVGGTAFAVHRGEAATVVTIGTVIDLLSLLVVGAVVEVSLVAALVLVVS
jgi:hypothetical protein